MRLLTWNLNGRRRIERQAAAVAGRAPDIVALQELTANSIGAWRMALADAGARNLVDSFSHAPPWRAVGPRRYGLLIASRFPLVYRTSEQKIPWPERVLSVEVILPNGAINVHTTHIPPGSSNGWLKVEMLEAVSALVADAPDRANILCGDFNVPQFEMHDGRIVTWGQDMADGEPRLRGRWRGGSGQRWDAAERVLMTGGAGQQLIDAYRHVHGYARQEFSWFVKRGERRIGRRFDHAFCTRDLKIRRCEYIHDVREDGLSDHAALELDFELLE